MLLLLGLSADVVIDACAAAAAATAVLLSLLSLLSLLLAVASQARHDKLGGPRPALLVVSLHADDTNRTPTFDMDLGDLFTPDGVFGCWLSIGGMVWGRSHVGGSAVDL